MDLPKEHPAEWRGCFVRHALDSRRRGAHHGWEVRAWVAVTLALSLGPSSPWGAREDRQRTLRTRLRPRSRLARWSSRCKRSSSRRNPAPTDHGRNRLLGSLQAHPNPTLPAASSTLSLLGHPRSCSCALRAGANADAWLDRGAACRARRSPATRAAGV